MRFRGQPMFEATDHHMKSFECGVHGAIEMAELC